MHCLKPEGGALGGTQTSPRFSQTPNPVPEHTTPFLVHVTKVPLFGTGMGTALGVHALTVGETTPSDLSVLALMSPMLQDPFDAMGKSVKGPLHPAVPLAITLAGSTH